MSSTLEQLLAAHRGGPAALDRLRARIRRDRSVSAGYLGLAFTALAGFVLARGLASLAWSWSDQPGRWLSLVAWALIVLAFATAVLAARMSGGVLPARFSHLVLAAGVLAVVADLWSFALGDGSASLYPTAPIGLGACLFVCLPYQPLRRSVVGAGILAATGVVTVTLGWSIDASSLSTVVTAFLLGLTPVAAGISMIHATDRHLATRIDQAVTESLFAVPALGHSVLAVSDLRRLDADSERLLTEVAHLPADQPIDASMATAAGVLGDALRHALTLDHTQTWLQIAVGESDALTRAVRIDDPLALAARLDPERRRTLLALVWLCVATAPAASAAIATGATSGAPVAQPTLQLTFIDSPAAVVFTLVSTHRQPIDPAVWPMFVQLGRHTADLAAGRMLVAIELD
ncbi:hypothetical protein [Subtercola endophyticus]|uniref:hypothetical protein n=1 Tax=Subtercola endophyticus TaxID=2895559 RepID=UPI001E3B8F02|nr:hypothetical protein [Subtercola endophyticus]UFS57565.1 hypothetical protein LQ955_10875 [Subtercola endophyticus]